MPRYRNSVIKGLLDSVWTRLEFDCTQNDEQYECVKRSSKLRDDFKEEIVSSIKKPTAPLDLVSLEAASKFATTHSFMSLSRPRKWSLAKFLTALHYSNDTIDEEEIFDLAAEVIGNGEGVADTHIYVFLWRTIKDEQILQNFNRNLIYEIDRSNRLDGKFPPRVESFNNEP